uniref:Methylosome subunit pICln n=1 Tax=Steinernema glaseri TaxID=37863 RepID=A0A1I7YH45_9BILA
MIVLNTVTEPTENIRVVQPQVALFFDNQSQGDGKLIVTERRVMIVLNTVTEPTENIRVVQPQVALFFDNQSQGDGKLIVTESAVTWISANCQKGFSLTYPSIILHAISRDCSSFPEECLYLLIDAKKGDLTLSADRPVDTPDSDGDEMEDDDMDHVTLRFVPMDKSILEHVYKQMCECQELNPSSDVSDEDYDYDEEPVGDEAGASAMYDDMGAGFEGQDWYGAGTNPDDVQLSAEGMANLQRILAGAGDAGENEDNEEMED